MALLAVALLSTLALAGCSDVGNQDEDGDGLYDSAERRGWQVTVDTLAERTQRQVQSKATDADSDDDGLPDQEEFFLATDPRSPDTDGDGLTDCQEVRHTARAQCEDEDFFGPFDGGYGTEPTKADSDPQPSLYVLNGPFVDRTGTLIDGRPDSGDGISDGEEVGGYTIALAGGATRVVRTDPRNGDSDGDRLDDGDERYVFGSDPTVLDTDGDGCEDGFDLIPGREERVRPGLGTFTLLRSTGSAPGADVVLTLAYANVPATVPSQGSVRVEEGGSVDWSAMEPAAAHSEQCTFTPDYWVPVQVAASDMESSGARSIDIATAAPNGGTGGVAVVYWNLHLAQLSWAADGKDPWPLSDGAVLSGADARLAIRPVLE